MKSKRNTLLRNTLTSIGLAAAIFVVIGVVFDVRRQAATFKWFITLFPRWLPAYLSLD